MIVFNYLSRQVFVAMASVTFVLLLIFMSGRFIKYLSQAASGSISPDILLAVMAYRLPGFLELILPLGFFMGIMLAYGRMYLESEMTVLHACGMSQNRLLGYSQVMAVAVSTMVAVMSLYLSPYGMQRVESLFVEQSQRTAFEMLAPGRFQSLGSNSRVTYAGGLSEDKRVMYDVFISEVGRDENSVNLLYAKKGVQTVDPNTGERFLVLHNGRRYEGVPGQADFKQLAFGSYGILISRSDAEQRKVKEEAILTTSLLTSDDPELVSVLYWRFSIVLLVPIVTLIAVAVCKVNPRQGRYVHLLPAMLLYVVYLGLLIVAKKKVAESGLSPVLAMGSIHVVFLIIGIGLLKRESIVMLTQRPFNKTALSRGDNA